MIDIQRSGSMLHDSADDIFSRLYPELFTYGLGHPGTKRAAAVSFEQCCAYYLQISSRKPSNNDFSTLISFDEVSRKRTLAAASII